MTYTVQHCEKYLLRRCRNKALFPAVSDDFDFDEDVFGKMADFDARPSRQGLLEIFAIDFIDGAKEIDIRQIYRRLDDIIVAETGFFQDSADVLHALFSLSDDRSGNDFAFFRVDSDLAGRKEEVTGFNSLRIRSYGTGSLGCADNLYCHVNASPLE